MAPLLLALVLVLRAAAVSAVTWSVETTADGTHRKCHTGEQVTLRCALGSAATGDVIELVAGSTYYLTEIQTHVTPAYPAHIQVRTAFRVFQSAPPSARFPIDQLTYTSRGGGGGGGRGAL